MKMSKRYIENIIQQRSIDQAGHWSSNQSPELLHRNGVVIDQSRSKVALLLPQKTGAPLRFDISFLGVLEGLSKPLAEGARIYCSSTRVATIQNTLNTLSGYFVRYLINTKKEDIRLEHLNRQFFLGYIAWLNGENAPQNVRQLSHGTRKGALFVVKKILRALRTSSAWSEAAQWSLQQIPANPWPRSHLKAKPKQRISRDLLKKIVHSAEREILEIRLRMLEGKKAIEMAKGELNRKNGNYRDNVLSCLPILTNHFPNAIPSLQSIFEVDKKLGEAVQYIHSLRGVTKYLYAGSRDLVPFVILLCVATAMNLDTVLTLKWKEIRKNQRLGLPVITILGKKNRSSSDPVVTLDAAESANFGISTLLDTLSLLTERLRPCVIDTLYDDRIFLFAQERAKIQPKSFYHKGGASGDQAIRYALKKFITENKLEDFNLDQLRPTVLDEIHLRTGDLNTVRSLARHRSSATSWNHYTSDGVRRRYKERLGETLMLRDRWLSSNGKIDPRKHQRTGQMDKGAATPGFLCLDPFDSPISTQRKGKLCGAYGECPSCPMAAASIRDPVAVALYLALRKSIYKSQGRVTPKAWLTKWGPILGELNSLLFLVPDEIKNLSSQYSVDLPTVG